MLKSSFFQILILTCLAFETAALPNYVIEHTPPSFELGKELIVKIPASRIKRSRVLIADKDGIRIKKLEKKGDSLETKLEFLSFALLKYQFQVEFEDGQVAESDYYYVRQPSTDKLEGEIRKLNNELSVIQTRIKQVENSIFSLRNTDKTVFQKKKGEELGKALIVLRKKEREHLAAMEEADRQYNAWTEKVNQDPRGKYVASNREEVERDNQVLWSSKGGK